MCGGSGLSEGESLTGKPRGKPICLMGRNPVEWTRDGARAIGSAGTKVKGGRALKGATVDGRTEGSAGDLGNLQLRRLASTVSRWVRRWV